MEINKEILRWVILLGATPIWLPFLLTLWKDFNDALREDGGLLGSPPTGRELDLEHQIAALQEQLHARSWLRRLTGRAR